MTAPYGSWPTPISARVAAEGMSGGQIAAPTYVGALGGEVWWIEPRPREDGRMALMRCRAGTAGPVLPAPWNARSRVIEYGGRPWAATATPRGVLVVFVHFDDQRRYAVDADVPGAVPRPLTPVSPARIAAGGTHDVEARHLDWLIGPPALVPERHRDRPPAAILSRPSRSRARVRLTRHAVHRPGPVAGMARRP